MLRKLVCASVALFLVAGVALAKEEKGEKKKPKAAFGKIVKYEKGTLTVMVKKSKEDEGTKTEFTINDDTKFLASAGRGKKPTPVSKEDIKEKFKAGTLVYVILDEEGKTAKSVTAVNLGGKKEKKEQ